MLGKQVSMLYQFKRYEPLGKAKLVDHDDRSVHLRAGSTTVEISALAPDLFRVGMFPEDRPSTYDSEAIAKNNWEPVAVKMSGEKVLALSTKAATVRINLDPLRVSFFDPSGRPFAADDEELGMGVVERSGSGHSPTPLGNPVRMYKRREEGERYFGCGERTGGLEKTGSCQIFWNVDPPEGHTASLNNLYASIPFVLSLRDSKAYGLFLDNTGRVEFDLAKTDENRACYGAGGGDLVYYVFCGPTPRDVLERYTELTGRTPMPPLWALGNQQSRWSYESAEELRKIARNFRDRDIPCDTLYLDLDYMDGCRVFTWNQKPSPSHRSSWLSSKSRASTSSPSWTPA